MTPNFGVIEKLTRACYFQIALETMILPVLNREAQHFISDTARNASVYRDVV